MLPLICVLAVQMTSPSPAAEPRATLLTQAATVDAAFDATEARASQTDFTALARKARAAGDLPLANAFTAKAAYARIIQGDDSNVRLTLIALIRDPASMPATRTFARQMLDFVNRPSDNLIFGRDPAGAMATSTIHVTYNGVRSSHR